MKWSPCHAQKPCPVCQSVRPARDGSTCRIRHDGVVWCTLQLLREDPGATPAGWHLVRHPVEGETGVLLSPLGPDGAPTVLEAKPPGEERDRDKAQEQWRQRGIERAWEIWRSTSADAVSGGRIAAYLAARGIDVAKLPEPGVPESLRFHARCPAQAAGRDAEVGPAMVGRIVEIGHKAEGGEGGGGRDILVQTGVHRTFLDPGGKPEKRAAVEESRWWPDAKQMLGACAGRAVWLARSYPRGVLIVGEGIETTLSAMVATGLGGWALLSALGIETMKLPLRLVHPKTGPVHTIIIAADLNKPKASKAVLDVFLGVEGADPAGLGKGDTRKLDELHRRAEKIAGELVPGLSIAEARKIAARPVGVQAGLILQARVQLVFPWVTVVVKAPMAPNIGIEGFSELVEWRDSADCPSGGEKGVDWNDCLRLEKGLQRVGAALLAVGGGVDLAANEARARAWDGPVAIVGGVDEDDGLKGAGASPDPSTEGADSGALAGAFGPAAGGGGGRGGNGRRNPPSQGGAGGAERGDGGGEGGWGRDVKLEDRSWRRLLPWDDQLLARMFLEELYAPELEERPSSGLHLMATPGPKREVVVHRFDGTAWSEISPRVVEEQVQGWLTPAAKAIARKDGTEHVPFEPTASKVRDVVRAVENAVLVTCEEDRFWMAPGFDGRGRPRWGMPAWAKYDQVHAGKPAPEQILTFKNVQLSREDLVRGVWNPLACSPLLYNRTYFPYELPLEEFEDCLVGGSFDAMTERLAPTWRKVYLPGLEWSPDEYEFMQKHFGYCQCFDLSHKEANVVVYSGHGNTGKGVAEEAFQLAVGENNIVKTSIDDVAGDRFHLASFRHKLAAVVSEQEKADRNARAKFLRVMKTLSGGDTMNTRQMYERERTNDRLWVRWLLSMNEMFDLEDESGALLNRLRVLDFRRDTLKVDRSVKRRVLQEGLGIVIWAIEGMVLGHGDENFEQPEESKTPLNVFMDYSAGMRDFVKRWLVITEGLRVEQPDAKAFLSAETLHRAYCKFKRWDPEKTNIATVNKKILAMLRHEGWRGRYSQPWSDDPKKPDHRESGWTGLRLSLHADAKMSYAGQETGLGAAPLYAKPSDTPPRTPPSGE